MFRLLSREGYLVGDRSVIGTYFGGLANVRMLWNSGHYLATWDEGTSGSRDGSSYAVLDGLGWQARGTRFEWAAISLASEDRSMLMFSHTGSYLQHQRVDADGAMGDETLLFSTGNPLGTHGLFHLWTGEQHVFYGDPSDTGIIIMDFVSPSGEREGEIVLTERADYREVEYVALAWNGTEYGVAWDEPIQDSQLGRTLLGRLSKAGEFVGEPQVISEQDGAAWGDIGLLAVADGWATTWIEQGSAGELAPFIRRMARVGPSPYTKLQLQQAWSHISPPKLIRTHEGLLVGWYRTYPEEMRSELVLQRFGLCE
jgi:hypothetical protein